MTESLTLVLGVGLPGTGKSTLAAEISRALGWPTIDKDTLMSVLLAQGVTREVAGGAAYQLMFAIGRDLLLHQRISVIFDSPDPYLSKVDELLLTTQAELKIVLCVAEREVRNRRVAERVRKLSQPVGISTTEGDGSQLYTHLPSGSLVVHTTQPVSEIIQTVLAYLQPKE